MMRVLSVHPDNPLGLRYRIYEFTNGIHLRSSNPNVRFWLPSMPSVLTTWRKLANDHECRYICHCMLNGSLSDTEYTRELDEVEGI